MSDPRPLREGTSRLFDRSLLESARDDRAPDGAEEKVLAALAVGAVGVGIGVVASQAGAGGTQVGAVASKVLSAVVLKWLGVGLVVTIAAASPVTYFAVVGTGESTRAGTGTGTGTGTASTGTASTGTGTASTSTSPSDGELEVTDVNALPAVAPVASVAPVAVRSAAPARSASSLSPELDVVDRARKALAGGDAVAARQALDEYQKRFPQGALREEAELASIETLVQSGDTAGARAAATSFLAAHPSSPYVGRARAILRRVSNP